MAESTGNVAKSCETAKENGVKNIETSKGDNGKNGKSSEKSLTNLNSREISKSIISQTTSPTQLHKDAHTSLQALSSSTTDASHINHVATKVDEKSGKDLKSLTETPSKDKKEHVKSGKIYCIRFYFQKPSNNIKISNDTSFIRKDD